MSKQIRVDDDVHLMLMERASDEHVSMSRLIRRMLTYLDLGAEEQGGTDMSVIENNIEQLFKSSDERYAEIQAINERLDKLESDDTVF